MKKRTKFILYTLIIIILISLFQQGYHISSINSLFSNKSVFVNDKKQLLDQLYAQSSLLSLQAENEMVLDSFKTESKERLSIRSKAYLTAGIDLRLLNEGDIFTEGDSIAIKLPPVEILETKVDTLGFTTLIQKGKWTNEEIIQLKSKAKNQFEQQFQSSTLPGRTEMRSRTILDALLRSLGFKKILLL